MQEPLIFLLLSKLVEQMVEPTTSPLYQDSPKKFATKQLQTPILLGFLHTYSSNLQYLKNYQSNLDICKITPQNQHIGSFYCSNSRMLVFKQGNIKISNNFQWLCYNSPFKLKLLSGRDRKISMPGNWRVGLQIPRWGGGMILQI